MNNKRLIHTYTKPKIKLLRYAFCLFALSVGSLLSIAFVIGPVILFILYRSAWFLLLGIFIPLGLWTKRYIFRFARKLFWQNRHLSSYRLFSDTIETIEWTSTGNTKPIKRKIPLKSIITVVTAPYFVRQTMTNYGVNRAITKTAPILFILYTKKGENRLLNIPLPKHDDPALNVWLNHFKKQLVPIDFTARFLYRKDDKFLNEEQRIDFFEMTDELMPLSFSGDWQTDYPFALEAWNERVQQRRRKEEGKILMGK